MRDGIRQPVGGGVEVLDAVEHGMHVILERADRIDADLIAIGTRNLQSPSTSRLGRVSWTVTRSANTHLLAVPLAREANLLDAED